MQRSRSEKRFALPFRAGCGVNWTSCRATSVDLQAGGVSEEIQMY